MGDSDGDQDDDMAAMMGFQSFGGAPKSKRRKVDVDVNQSTTAPATSANATVIAHTRHTPTAATTLSQPATTADERHKGQKQKAKNRQPMTGLAAFLAHGQELPDAVPLAATEHQARARDARSDEAAQSRECGGAGADEVASSTEAPLSAYRMGVRNANGDIAYFLPSFIEDPWSSGG